MGPADIVSYIGIGVTALCALVFVLGVIGGLRRGWLLTLIRLGVILVSFVFALIVTNVVKGAFTQTGSDLLYELLAESLDGFPAETVMEVCGALGSALVAPLAFSVIYFAADLVLHIVFHIVTHSWRPDTDAPMLSRLAGAGIGAVSALVACTFLFLTFGGVPKVINQAHESLQDAGASEELIAPMAELDEAFEGQFVLSTLKTCGSLVFDSVSKVKTSVGENTLCNEVGLFCDMLGKAQGLPSEIPAFQTEDVTQIKVMVQDAEDSVLLRPVLGSAVPFLAKELSKGNEAMGISMPEQGDILAPFFTDLFSVMASANAETVCDDLQEVADLFNVLIKYKVFENLLHDAGATAAVTAPGFLSETRQVLRNYPRFAPLAQSLDGVMLRALATNIDTEKLLEADATVFEDVASTLNGIREEELTAEALEEKVTELLEESGIALDENLNIHEITQQTVEIFEEAFADKETITGADVKELLEKYGASGASGDLGNLGNLGGLEGLLP